MRHNFRNLDIWKLAIQLSAKIYQLTDDFPKNEEFGLKSQLRRSAISVASNIAEGSSRSSDKDFNRFLEISIGSLFELQTQIVIANIQNYIDNENYSKIDNEIITLQKMISGFQKKLLNNQE